MHVVSSNAAVALTLALSAVLPLGCKTNQVEPEFAPSTDQPSYAKQHPAQLKAVQQNLEDQLTLASTLTGELEDYPAELKDPDWKGVAEVVEQADHEGRSQHYAENLEQNGKIAAFYEAEKPEIHKRVGGAVQYHAKEKGCTADMYSPAVHALDKAVDKQLEERTHESSEAHSYIALNAETLGKANVEALERQADRIALGSYVTHIGLVQKKNQLDRLLADADAVDRTLARRIEELEQAAPPEGQGKPSDKARTDELGALAEARTTLGAELEPARKQAETLEQRIQQVRQAYLDALSALKKSIDELAEKTPKPAEP